MILKFNKKKVNIGHEELAYVEHGEGSKVLLLIHGNLSSSLHYEPLIKELEKDYKVYAPDLRGFGDSSYNNRFDSIEEIAADIILFIEKLNLKDVNIVGWSAGGAVAQVVAGERPELVEKMVLIATGSPKGFPVFKKDENNNILIGQTYRSKGDLAKDPLQVAPVLNMLMTQNAAMMAYVWDLTIYNIGNKPTTEENAIYINESLKQKSLVDIDWALCKFNITNESGFYGPGTGLINKINAPTLILWGDHDLTVNKYMFDETLRLFNGKAKSIVYENCGHSPIVDRPKQVSEDIKNFIK